MTNGYEPDETVARLETSVRKSVVQLYQQMGGLASQSCNATKLKQLHPHKTKVLQNLYDAACAAGPNSVNWYLQRTYAGHINPSVILFSMDNSHLSRHANSQDNRYQTATNLLSTHKVPLNDIKDRVWCPMRATRITEPINSQQHATFLLTSNLNPSLYARTQFFLSERPCMYQLTPLNIPSATEKQC
jgi:hypothetical protein